MASYVFLLLSSHLYHALYVLIFASLMALIETVLFTALTVCEKPPDKSLGKTGGFTIPVHSTIHKEFKLK